MRTTSEVSDYSRPYTESEYSETRRAPPPLESTYSMPMSNHPPPGAYANIAASHPPESTYSMPLSNRAPSRAYADIADSHRPDTPSSVRFDNGTGQLSREILHEIRQTGRIPKNVPRNGYIDAMLESSQAGPSSKPHVQAVHSSRPQAYQAPVHQSITPSLAYAASHRSTTSNREKRYGNQDLPLAPAPLSLASRKKTAGAGVAGIRPPVPPVPPFKDTRSHPPRNESSNAEFTAVAHSSPYVATSRQHQTPDSYQLQDLEAQASAHSQSHSQSHSRYDILHAQTRPPTRQGRHIERSTSRPSPRPATPPKSKGKGRGEEMLMDEPTHAAAVAAGRAIWNDMRSHQRPRTPGERPVWVQQSRSGEPVWNGRNSPIQGEFLRQGSVYGVSVSSKSVHDGAKEERKYLERQEKQRAKTIGKAPADDQTVRGLGRAKTYTSGKSSKSVVGSIKNSGSWWQRQGWRYGDGHWERKKPDQKGKAKKKGEVRLDEYGRPIETSGWYTDSDD